MKDVECRNKQDECNLQQSQKMRRNPASASEVRQYYEAVSARRHVKEIQNPLKDVQCLIAYSNVSGAGVDCH
jgi:hypothetical protein